MSLVRPNKFCQLTEEELSVERPVTEDTLRKLIYNSNMLRALMPIGMVKAYNVNIQGVSQPLSTIYEFCDGTEISDPNSPINGVGQQFKPNMSGRFLRGGFASDTQLTEQGGTASPVLGSHNHTTNVVFDGGNRLEAGGQRYAFEPFHNHAIFADTGTGVANPKHIVVGFYLKVNV
jgi:hypothetical protein